MAENINRHSSKDIRGPKAQHQSSWEKYKSKLQWAITSHLSEAIKSTTQETLGIFDDMEKEEELSCTVSGNANWWSHSGKQYADSQKGKNRLYNPATALLGTYPNNTKTLFQNDACTPMFTPHIITIMISITIIIYNSQNMETVHMVTNFE